MSLPQTVAEVLREHVTLEVEGIDRMYLNVYVPHGASPVFSVFIGDTGLPPVR
jgi:hypothetical protein